MASRKTAPKPPMGRPRLPAGRVRETFTLRITAAERESFEAAALAAELPITQWARAILIKQAQMVARRGEKS